MKAREGENRSGELSYFSLNCTELGFMREGPHAAWPLGHLSPAQEGGLRLKGQT